LARSHAGRHPPRRGGERPHIVFLSAPCKGFSGLLSEKRSNGEKYQALNRLTLRGMWLMLEAWSDDPPELIIFENVPRIATRGRHLLDRIVELLHSYGYAVAETTHDCGELGGLAQSRKRFLMVARHAAKVPAFLYEPPKRPLRAVGEVLGRLPMPGDVAGGPMHSIPNLHWKTWVRLAFVEAGSDWRSLNKLNVIDGMLADYLMLPERWYGGILGVQTWDEPAATISGRSGPTTGAYSVADPRIQAHPRSLQHGVRSWDEPAPTVTCGMCAGQGPFSVADPRINDGPSGPRFNNVYRIVEWEKPSPAVSAGCGPTAGGLGVADPRPPAGPMFSKYAVTKWDQRTGTVIGGDDSGAYAVADPRAHGLFSGKGKYNVAPFDAPAHTVIAQSTTGHGAFSVADPRIGLTRSDPYGVVGWDETAGAIAGAARHDNGRFNVADPRLPAATEKLVAIIRALDGTWHRPFTTLELAALQSLIDPDDIFDLDGISDSGKRERIGNAVPPGAAQAIADLMGQTLLLSWSGESFQLSSTPIWVRPVAVALSVRTAHD
jgi:site-specific DNA-cytosine methylase